MVDSSLINRAAALLDSARSNSDDSLSPLAVALTIRAGNELLAVGADPLVGVEERAPAAALAEALRLLSTLSDEDFQSPAVVKCVRHAQSAYAETRPRG